jgi:hypothetical protein
MGKRGSPGVRLLSVAALVCSAGAARAQAATAADATHGGDGDWSATAARTIPPGQSVLQLEAGWPGVSLAFLRGQTRSSDIGARLSFLYGFEGTTRTIAGLQFQVPYRRLLLGGADFASLAVHVDPGFTVYWSNSDRGGTEPGFGGPIGLVAGFRIDSRLTLEAGADFPIFLSFIHPLGLFLGPQLGGGAEYHLEPNLAVTLRARFGPNFAAANGDTSTNFAFSTLLGLAYNMR